MVKNEVRSYVTLQMIQNAHKLAYLIKAYPEKTAMEVIGLFRLSPIDINCAFWCAVEEGLISDVDEDSPKAKFLKSPRMWDFGGEERGLESALTYAFEKLNQKEQDMEENFLASWTTGYTPQDVLIAVKHLIEENVIAEYEIRDTLQNEKGEDISSTYIFYTLKENADKKWGAKQFKVDPLAPDGPAIEGEIL